MENTRGITHIGVWTLQPEILRDFYTTYFNGTAGEKYTNPGKGFESYFIRFENGTGIEIMRRVDVTEQNGDVSVETLGWSHLAFSVGSPADVDRLTALLSHDGYQILGKPRRTGDGFYESVMADPDGNRVEITE